MPTQIIRTTCTMDCPDTCGLEVTISEEKIQRIRGTQDHPTTNGFICDKISRFARRVYHEDRLLYPRRRNGRKGAGAFVRISWDEAVAEITTRFKAILRQWGGEAILPYHYGGSNGLLGDKFLDDFYFATLGAVLNGDLLPPGPPIMGLFVYNCNPAVTAPDQNAVLRGLAREDLFTVVGEFNYPALHLTIHPADATARQIVAGDLVRVFNDLGEVVCRAQVSTRVREGVVSLPKGAWRKSSLNGLTATALCPDDINVVGGGACFNASLNHCALVFSQSSVLLSEDSNE